MLKELKGKIFYTICRVVFEIYRRLVHSKNWKLQNIGFDLIKRTPRFYSNILFGVAYKKLINWKNPVWFDEKLNCLKCGLYWNNDDIIMCADKYRVREYIESKDLGYILNEIFWNGDDFTNINIEEFPNSFVIKRNNDCGGLVIVTDKDKEEKLDIKMQNLLESESRTFGLSEAEYHYQYITPHYFVEKFLGTSDGHFPYDYKFFCMNGKPRVALICVGREDECDLLRFTVDMNFHLLQYMVGEKYVEDEMIQRFRPQIWEELKCTAEKLAGDFPFVRVDLYDVDSKVVFGEMTFTPMGCRNKYFSEEAQLKLGAMLDISNYM